MESSKIIEMLLDDILIEVTRTLPPDQHMPLPHIQNSSSEESFEGGEEGQTLGSSDSGANFSDYPGTEGIDTWYTNTYIHGDSAGQELLTKP